MVATAVHYVTFWQVSAVSGDVRRSLELCRRAAELAEAEHRYPSEP